MQCSYAIQQILADSLIPMHLVHRAPILLWLYTFFLSVVVGNAELMVTVLPPRITAQKVVVPIVMKNNFSEAVEGARAVVFVMDESGQMLGQGTRWVIGGKAEPTAALIAGGTNTFYFVVNSQRLLPTTNIVTQVKFSRLLLQSGRVADPERSVSIKLRK